MTQHQMPAAGGTPSWEPPVAGSVMSSSPVAEVPGPTVRSRSVRGLWYYLVTLISVGTFAWIPFLHAALRLRTTSARLTAVGFAVADALIYTAMALTPPHGNSGAISGFGGLLMMGAMIGGCVLLTPLRRMVYLGAPVPAPRDDVDPAVRAVLAARARREESRALAAKDPLLAHELHIGRPDLTRTYDDGGLVDVNTAPAAVIAGGCGIPVDAATRIVDARDRQGGRFANIDELLVVAEVPMSTWDQLRDRGIVLS
jgi:hypothetical protein